jgi:hypothetical protein
MLPRLLATCPTTFTCYVVNATYAPFKPSSFGQCKAGFIGRGGRATCSPERQDGPDSDDGGQLRSSKGRDLPDGDVAAMFAFRNYRRGRGGGDDDVSNRLDVKVSAPRSPDLYAPGVDARGSFPASPEELSGVVQ